MGINKKELYNKCLDAVNERIEKYQGKMEEISGNAEQHTIHPEFDEYGNKGEVLTSYENFAGYLDNAQKMKETLANLGTDHRSETVKQGSIVETEKAYFYISVPLGEIALEDGSEVYAISTEAPIYRHLEGKKAGDSFNFEGMEIKIMRVH